MFQYGQLSNALFQVQHQHSDGSWATLEAEAKGEGDPHDPAGLDPEQQWQRGHVFVCRSCEERVRIAWPEGERPTG